MKLRDFKFQMIVAALAMAIPCVGQFQGFSSGSNGSDGALDFSSSPPGTIINFNPASYTPPLNPSGNNIFNFTTINIPSGVTVRLSGRNLTGPVYWLASGAVAINGTLDLSGEVGSPPTQDLANRVIAYPGAGGYAGGLGGQNGVIASTSGQGPSGGGAGSPYPGAAGFTGNLFLVPLVGGSGGGGSLAYYYFDVFNQFYIGELGSGGGAGGGAILIASSTSIACNGGINANGGNAFYGQLVGGGGAGGAIHLIAPVISGGCSVSASGSTPYPGAPGVNGQPGAGGANGRIRIETASYTGSFGFSAPFTITSTPNLYLPATPPGKIQTISVNGVNLPASPMASFATPDVSINTPNAVPVVVQAANIPVGTVVTLQINSEEFGDISFPCPPLTGTLTSSTTTANVVIPAGLSRAYITASW